MRSTLIWSSAMPAPDAQMRELQSLCRENNLEEALATAERLITREQAFGQVHAIRIDLLLSLARRSDAESAFDSALHEFGSMSEALDGLAYYARRLGRHALSKQLYERATQDRPHDAQLWYNLATGERSLGELEKAYSASARALALQPDHMPAVLLRSEVRTATPDENHVGDLKARLSSNNSRQRMFLAYAAGKELHDLGRYAEAFEAFAKGAAARRKALSYDVATDERKIARIIEVFGANTTQSTPTPTAHDRHIFIVGLPRSGTTLVERILGSLPDVESNGETDNFSNALLQSAPPLPGDVFQRCAAAPADQVARRYEALAGRKNPDTRVIEKLPLNYLYVGAIARSFERSPIVWVRRHPLENCFAMFRTLFGEGCPSSDNSRRVAA
jgi:tetratricopeptide (TPR) repeat protein